MRLTLVPAYVQGDRAPDTLMAALKRADRLPVDVVLLVRGGGSFEDLNAFNDEALVRVIAGMQKPVIAGIGHETDETLAGLAADYAASTPTAAAERLGEEKTQWEQRLNRFQRDLREGVERRVLTEEQYLDEVAEAMKNWMRVNVTEKAGRCTSKGAQLTLIARSHLKNAEAQLKQLQLSQAIRLALRNRSSTLDWCARALSVPNLVGKRREDLERRAERLHQAIHEKLNGKKERVTVYSRL
ncbi:exodeoxyribonuclease VII large subunit, partial [gut metagenome]